ncbi:protein hemingway isoform X1 [Drosophila subpulchrella]|uniref:protein hemingway isoform X1 n=1 Tax=Drosophila subpulchrella TaxID=1486046 RepID=UPI0018A17610|nr:protein hemingway isoform X1 [Drosophila subpulchrella]
MSEAGENSDEEYYAEESFEEDSQSEVEEQEEEEVEEVEDEEDENVELEKPNQNGALHLEESDTQSESDAEAEFIRGNPHARRQMAGRSSGGFNRDRMVSYPSSSSEDESQVVITKTVAEVNQLSLRLDTPLEDDAPSVRTLMPGSAHSRTKDEVVEDDEDAEVEEVEEVEEEEEIQSGDDDAQSDGTMESNDGRQSGEETDEDEGTDVEVEQLEEDEPIVTAVCRQKVQEKIPLPLQEDLVSLVDASDNSSEHSVATMCMAGDETDVTLEESPRFQNQRPGTETVIEEEEPEEDVLEDHLKNLSELLNNESPSPTQQPDLARVRYLEQQMTQMSEIIMKSFQINGGTPNSQAFEQLAMARDLMQQRSLRLEETESEMASMTESAMTSARSLGGGRPPIRMRMQRSQEALITTRPSKLIRPKCRCPLESELIEQEQELQMSQQLGQKLGQGMEPDMGLGMGIDEDYLVDECGQGDGLMRHPQQRRPTEFKRRAASGTPSSFNSDGCEYPINVSRSRCSTDKVNYKNLGRKSFSFTNPQVREIERQNQILLRKMMTVKPTATIKASTSSLKIGGPEKQRQPPPAPRLSSAAVNRKKFQRQIDLDNDLLKRKLEAIGTRRPQFK